MKAIWKEFDIEVNVREMTSNEINTSDGRLFCDDETGIVYKEDELIFNGKDETTYVGENPGARKNMKSKLKIPRKLSQKHIEKCDKKIKEFVIDKEKGKKVRIVLPPSRNSATLASFALYCQQNPEQRFWQALRNWSEHSFIVADSVDTFYWEGKRA